MTRATYSLETYLTEIRAAAIAKREAYKAYSKETNLIRMTRLNDRLWDAKARYETILRQGVALGYAA